MGLKPEPKNQASLDRGTALHAAIESYLRGEADAIEDPLAKLHQAVIDARKVEPGLEVEERFDMVREGIAIRGYIDLHTSAGVWDHKTSSDIKKWGEKPDTIAHNLQLNLYAAHWFTKYPEADTCTVGHLQYQTKGASKVQLVEAVLTRAHVEQYLIEVVDPLLRLQKTVANMPAAEYVEPNRTACWAYGGCPFKDKECKPFQFREYRPKMTEAKQIPAVMVFIGARPHKRACESIDDLIAEALDQEDSGLSASHPDFVEYGKGYALFAEAIMHNLKQRSGTVYIYARSEDRTARALLTLLTRANFNGEIKLHDIIEAVK